MEDLVDCLRNIFLKSEDCDVTFTVNGKNIGSHRTILSARSKVFKKMLFGDMKEAQDKRHSIVIEDTNFETFKQFLLFLYTDEVEITAEHVFYLVHLAKKYDIEKLVKRCENYLGDEKVWDMANIFSIIDGTIMFDLYPLKQKCSNFLKENSENIFTSPQFKELKPNVLKFVIDNEHLNLPSEMVKIQACISWAEHQQKKNQNKTLRELLKDILCQIDFDFLTVKELISIRSSGILLPEEILNLIEIIISNEGVHLTRKIVKRFKIPDIPNDWVMLMKAKNGSTFEYNSTYWTTSNTLNPNDSSLEFSDSKYQTFNDTSVSELLLIAENKRWVRLKLPVKQPLLSYFTNGTSMKLDYISGCRTPTELAGSDIIFKYYDPIWRIQTTGSAKLRLGGWFPNHWRDLVYGNDGIGNCSAEWAGLGISDASWGPFIHACKSFGIRTAHDKQQSDNLGNVSLGILVFGRP